MPPDKREALISHLSGFRKRDDIRQLYIMACFSPNTATSHLLIFDFSAAGIACQHYFMLDYGERYFETLMVTPRFRCVRGCAFMSLTFRFAGDKFPRLHRSFTILHDNTACAWRKVAPFEISPMSYFAI